jgi:putative tricarboxylic transport membrane protein
VADKIFSGILLLFCLVYLYFSTDMSFGIPSSPKSGFLPTVAGTIGSILAAINFLKVMRTKNSQGTLEVNFKKAGLFFGALVIYLVAMKYIGYAIATGIAMLLLLKVTETKGWIKPVAISLGTAVVFYVVFERLLGVQLPAMPE